MMPQIKLQQMTKYRLNTLIQRVIIFLFINCLFILHSYTQIDNIVEKILLARSKIDTNMHADVDTFIKVTKFYRDFEKLESKLNGEINFSGNGTSSLVQNIHTIGAGFKLNTGTYPYSVKVNSNFQTTVNNGTLTENISEVGINFNYFPIGLSKKRMDLGEYILTWNLDSINGLIDSLKLIKHRIKSFNNHKIKILENTDRNKKLKRTNRSNKKRIKKNIGFQRKKRRIINRAERKNSGLWFETFAFINRFGNSFLGIDQRYESGGGFIFNHFSAGNLTKKGSSNKNSIDKLPYYKIIKTQKETEKIAYNAMWYKAFTLPEKSKIKHLLKDTLKIDSTLIASFQQSFNAILANNNSNIKVQISDGKLGFLIEDSIKLEEFITKIQNENTIDNDKFRHFLKLINSKNSQAKIQKILRGLPTSKDHFKGDLAACIRFICVVNNLSHEDLDITKTDIQTLSNLGFKYRNLNIKKYAKWRFSFLLGLYGELEQAKSIGILPDLLIGSSFLESDFPIKLTDPTDSTKFEIANFPATEKLRIEARPSITYLPNDKLTFTASGSWKMPLIPLVQRFDTPDVKSFNEQGVLDEDFEINDNLRRLDGFIDVKANINWKIYEALSLSFGYRYLVDLAPKRIIVNAFDQIIPLEGQRRSDYFEVKFSYGF